MHEEGMSRHGYYKHGMAHTGSRLMSWSGQMDIGRGQAIRREHGRMDGMATSTASMLKLKNGLL